MLLSSESLKKLKGSEPYPGGEAARICIQKYGRNIAMLLIMLND